MNREEENIACENKLIKLDYWLVSIFEIEKVYIYI